MADRLSRANITVYDPALPGNRVLRVTTGNGHMTRPTDTPANTFFLPVLKQPADMSRHMFAPGTTSGRSKVGLGDVVITNADGALDGWMNYAFDGWPITIEDGTVEGGFTSVLVATMDGTPDFGSDAITIHLRDRQAELDVPLQKNLYLGNNALPAGLEGVADLQGKPKPFCLGQALNVPAVCINTSKLIYQLHDGALASIGGVYDRGVALGFGFTWSAPSSGFAGSAILASAYGAGLFVIAGAGGKLSTSPDGQVWTARTSSFGATTINAVWFANNLFVAVGDSGKVATSADGINWTQRVSGLAVASLFCVTYGNGLWVVPDSSGKVGTSADGITWATTAVAWTSTVKGIAYGNGYFVSVGAAGQFGTSSDGSTWVMSSPTNILQANLNGVIYANGLFVAVGNGGLVAISDIGTVWRVRDAGFGANNVFSAVSGLGIFVVGGGSGKVAYSPDGLTWTQAPSPLSSSPQTLSFGNGSFIGAGAGGSLDASVVSGYANTTDLLDDTLAPPPGFWRPCLSAGMFRLGSRPAGVVTADPVEGTTAADRTVAQLFKRALLKAGKTAADYVAADFVALDALNSAICGLWINDGTTVSNVLDQIAGSIWAWWAPDRAGLYRIKQFAAPSGASTFSFGANDLRKSLEVTATSDEGKGVPAYRTIVRYARNYTVQTTDLAASVSAARRVVLGAEWQAAKYETAGVQTAHLLAPEITEDSCLVNAADALAEATRRQGIRGTRRDRFPLLVELTDANSQIDFGDVGTLTHTRFGLAAGTLVRVLGCEPNKARNEVLLTVWR